MPVPTPTPVPHPAPEADQRLIMYGIAWSGYEAQLALRGDAPVPRVAYLDGAMELMSPARDHERIKSYIGLLIETYALDRGIEFSPYGAWTLRHAPKSAGLARRVLRHRLRTARRATPSSDRGHLDQRGPG